VTPEGRVKKAISSYLEDVAERMAARGGELHWSMYVPSGYGKRNTLDYTLCFCGEFVAIEAKAPDEDLKPNQRFTARPILRSGGKVFIISGLVGLQAFKDWIERHDFWEQWPAES
jgi:hypothetical protein